MIGIETTVVIARPVDQVFAFVADLSTREIWCGGTLESKQTSAGPLGTGATFHETFRLFLGLRGYADNEITDYEPNERFSFVTTSGRPGAGTRMSLTFEPADGGTRVTEHAEYRFPRFRFLEPLSRGMAQRNRESDLARLKSHLER